MRRIESVSMLTIAVGLLSVSSLSSIYAQGTKKTAPIDRPGDEPYNPTKIEWASVELQAIVGNSTFTSETPVLISFVDKGDGKTVVCIVQYTPEVPAGVVKTYRDSVQGVFDTYVESHRWPWFRLRFDEKVLRR